jgi:hypothetical protein
MADKKNDSKKTYIAEGYQPSPQLHTRGYQATSKPQGGHQPTTSEKPKLPHGGSSESE